MNQTSSTSIVGNCSDSKCGVPIYADHKAINCLKCGLILPQEMRDQLPELKKQADLSTAIGLGVGGGFVGMLLGYLFRPSVPLLGQLDFFTVLTRGSNLSSIDRLLVPIAESSFNQLLFGAVIGGVIGLVGGYMYVTTSREKRESLVSQLKETKEPKIVTKNNESPKQEGSNDFASHLKLLAELKNDGVLTEAEFQEKKKELLGRI